MAGETTPLAGAASAASSMFTSENAQKATDYAREKAKELRVMAREGDFSIRLLALLGGIAMTIISALGFLGTFLKLSFLAALVELYTFILGVIIVLLEGTKMPFVSTRFRENLNKYALFLRFVWGRGLLYFVAGSLQLTQSGLLDVVCGAYVCLVGILYIFVGQRTAKKLRELRSSLYSEQTLRSKFNEADVDGQGKLTLGQFKHLTDSLGLDLNRREAEAAFLHLDKSNDGSLTFEEFQTWWMEWDDQDHLGSTTPFEFA